MLPFMLSMTLDQLPSYEPNWFLSTIVQSTAALVAIVGGFLISRLISMVSERSSHLHRMAELENRKQITANAIEDQRRKIQSRTNDWFFNEKLEEVIKSSGTIEAGKVASEFYAAGQDESLTLAYAEKMVNITKRAYKDTSKIYGPRNPPPTTADELRATGFQIEGHEEEVIFEKVAERIASMHALVGAFDSLRYGEPNWDLGNIIPNHEIRQHDNQIAKKLDLKASLSFIEAEIALIESKLPSLADPKRLIWGFGVLAYFGGAGILYPLYLMTKNPVEAPISTRTTVFLAFLSGFLLLLLYIANSVRELGNSNFARQRISESDTKP